MPELCYSFTSLFEFITKKKLHTWKSALTKFSRDALISFVELIPHFRIFVRTYNWNHYRPIRVNVISFQLKSRFFFWPKAPNFGYLGKNFRKRMFDLKSPLSKQNTGKISLRIASLYSLAQNAQLWGF